MLSKSTDNNELMLYLAQEEGSTGKRREGVLLERHGSVLGEPMFCHLGRPARSSQRRPSVMPAATKHIRCRRTQESMWLGLSCSPQRLTAPTSFSAAPATSYAITPSLPPMDSELHGGRLCPCHFHMSRCLPGGSSVSIIG